MGSRNGCIGRIERGARGGGLFIVTLNLLGKRRLAGLGGVLRIGHSLGGGLVECIGLGHISIGGTQRLVGGGLGCRGIDKCLGSRSGLGLCGLLLPSNQCIKSALGGCGGFFLVLVLGVSLGGLVSDGKGVSCLFYLGSYCSQRLVSSGLGNRDVGDNLGGSSDLSLSRFLFFGNQLVVGHLCGS